MTAYDRNWLRPLVASLLIAVVPYVGADTGAITGTWALNEGASDSLEKQMNALKQEYRTWESEHGNKEDDPEKPSPFDSNNIKDKKWDARRSGTVAKPSVAVNRMVTAELIKLYVAERIVVAYDRKLRRLLNPNPLGRVHSAKGYGISKDSIGETLAYLDEDAVVIETRTKNTERLAERFEVTPVDQLKVTTRLYNPDWRREVEFVRVYDRDTE